MNTTICCCEKRPKVLLDTELTFREKDELEATELLSIIGREQIGY